MSENPAEVFRANLPGLTQEDTVIAAQDGRTAISFSASPITVEAGTIDALTLKLSLTNGQAETVILGRYAATVLHRMLSHLEENKWTELPA